MHLPGSSFLRFEAPARASPHAFAAYSDDMRAGLFRRDLRIAAVTGRAKGLLDKLPEPDVRGAQCFKALMPIEAPNL